MSSLPANYIPSAHYLETWDLHQYPGDDNYLIQQPVVSKLNKQSISSGDFLLKLFGITGYDSYYDLIKDIKRTDEDTWINNVRAGLIRSGADEHNKSGINTQLPININRFSEKSIDSKELHLIKVKNPYLLDN